MGQGFTPQEELEFYFLVRNVRWRYRLDAVEDEVITRISGLLREMRTELYGRISKYAAGTFSRKRLETLLAEIEVYQTAVQQQAVAMIAETAGAAGAASLAEQFDILSLSGKAAGIQGVTLGASDFGALMLTSPLGGHKLQDWVDRAFGEGQSRLADAIQTGMFQGEGYRKIINRVLAESESISQREAITLTRTYVQSASAMAQEATYRANADVVERVKWSAILEPGYMKTGRGTCLRCAANDGLVWTLNEPQPEVPLHPRCFTGDTEVFAPDAIAISRANYSGPIYDFIIEGGAKFSITPNHMILTSRGFIPAKEVCQSDKIIGSAYINGLRQNNNRAPSNFAQIFNFLSNSDAMLTTDRNSTSDNFHGDGQFINGNIDIVGAKSLLLGGVKPCLDQLLKNEKLPLANMSNVLFPGYGKSAAMLKAMGLATQALTSGLSMSEFFSGSHSGFSDNTGLAGCSDFNAVFSKSFSNNPFAGVESVSEFIGRLPGVISLANYFFGKINPLAAFSGDFFDFISSFRFTTPLNSLPDKSVHNNFFSKSKFITDFFLHLPHEVKFFDINFLGVRDFSGHVYDLQTVSTVYHVAGMYSSNCRCMKLPLPDWSKLGLDAETMNRATRPFTVRPDEKIDAGGRRTILEAGRHQGDYASWFAGRGKIFQRNVLGPRRYELYQQGADFHSFVNSVNGELYTLKELEGR